MRATKLDSLGLGPCDRPTPDERTVRIEELFIERNRAVLIGLIEDGTCGVNLRRGLRRWREKMRTEYPVMGAEKRVAENKERIRQ